MSTSNPVFSSEPPVVCVSYSHINPDHAEWVAALARRLRSNGVDVRLDKWDVRLGEDLNLFIEKFADDDARVLVVLSDDYASKANDRGNQSSGVGTETQILSQSLYSELGSNKVIPVIPDSGTVAGKPKLPIFLGNRSYTDFRNDYEAAYETLLRELLDEPAEPAPPLGPNPFVGITAEQATVDLGNNPLRWLDGRTSGKIAVNLHENSGRFTIGTGDASFHLFIEDPRAELFSETDRPLRHYNDEVGRIGLIRSAIDNAGRFENLAEVSMTNRIELSCPGDVVVMLNNMWDTGPY